MYIRSNSWFERYQADTVELDSRITTHNHAYPYLLIIVYHFSKYEFAYVIPVKKQKQLELHGKCFCNWRASNASYR